MQCGLRSEAKPGKAEGPAAKAGKKVERMRRSALSAALKRCSPRMNARAPTAIYPVEVCCNAGSGGRQNLEKPNVPRLKPAKKWKE